MHAPASGSAATQPAPGRGCRARRLRRAAPPAALAAASPSAPPLLEVEGLCARVVGGERDILRGVNLVVREGETHAIMGTNGSGKSTLSKVLVGHPAYEVTGGSARYKGADLLALAPEARAHAGLFLSFQAPVEIPGVRCGGSVERGLAAGCMRPPHPSRRRPPLSAVTTQQR